MLVKRLASLQQHNNLKSLQQTKEIRNCRERDRNSEDKKSNESKEQNDKRKILEPTSEDHYINDKISTSTRTEKIMGSNVSSGKGLSGRRTQSQSEYDMICGLSVGKLLYLLKCKIWKVLMLLDLPRSSEYIQFILDVFISKINRFSNAVSICRLKHRINIIEMKKLNGLKAT